MATEPLEEPAPETTDETPPAEGYKITLDMTIPEVADAFANCEPGEVLTVESKDDAEIVLSKELETPEEEAAPTEEAEPKSAVGRLMAKKMAA